MISAHLKRLISSHDKSGLSTCLMLEELDISGSTFLPFTSITIKSEELSSHLELLLLFLLVGLNVDFLGKMYDRFKIHVRLMCFWIILLNCR